MKKTLAATVIALLSMTMATAAHADTQRSATGDDATAGVERTWMWDCNGDGRIDHISGGGVLHLWYGSVRDCDLLGVTYI